MRGRLRVVAGDGFIWNEVLKEYWEKVLESGAEIPPFPNSVIKNGSEIPSYHI